LGLEGRSPEILPGNYWDLSSPTGRDEAKYFLPLKITAGKQAIGTRPFLSTKAYFGLAPRTSRKSDKSAILLGAKVSFVLRSDGEFRYYKLVGSCNLKGIMNGEISRLARSDTKLIEYIRIR
jgi:hypothetical protein